MLKKRDLNIEELYTLYDLITHPEVFPYVREKPNSLEEYIEFTKRNIELEKEGKVISRTILSDENEIIGTINLYDIENHAGFLGTWIGKEFHGKGINQKAKQQFFQECFTQLKIEKIYMKIRKYNIRSQKAALKLSYVALGNKEEQEIYNEINKNGEVFDLYVVHKENFYKITSKNEGLCFF